MTLVELLIVLAVVAAVVAVAVGVVRADLDEPVSSLPQAGVPDGDLVADDVTDVRFSLGLRGYRMSEVDEVLDRVAAELSRRDDEIADLRAQLAERPAAQPANVDGRPGWTAPEDA